MKYVREVTWMHGEGVSYRIATDKARRGGIECEVTEWSVNPDGSLAYMLFGSWSCMLVKVGGRATAAAVARVHAEGVALAVDIVARRLAEVVGNRDKA